MRISNRYNGIRHVGLAEPNSAICTGSPRPDSAASLPVMTPGAEPTAVRYPSIGQAILLVIVAVVLQAATGATAFAILFAKLGDFTAAANQLKNVWVLALVILISNGLTLALGLRAAPGAGPAVLSGADV